MHNVQVKWVVTSSGVVGRNQIAYGLLDNPYNRKGGDLVVLILRVVGKSHGWPFQIVFPPGPYIVSQTRSICQTSHLSLVMGNPCGPLRHCLQDLRARYVA